MRFIGITGGVGAGKSAVLSYLNSRKRVRTMMADRIAEELMEPGGSCYAAVKELFAGEPVFLENGRIDRPAMAAVIFRDEKMREALNELVHPAVRQYVCEQKELEEQKGELDFLFLEAALLIEEHYDEICDELWYIYTSKENRTKRLMESRGYSEQKINRIFESQLSEVAYRRACSRVIDNNGTEKETELQLEQLMRSKGEFTDGTCKG